MNLAGMSVYPDYRTDKKGRKNGPYYIGSIYQGTVNGKKDYRKVYLGKNLVRGLVKQAEKNNEEITLEEIEKLSVKLLNFMTFRHQQEIFFDHLDGSVTFCRDGELLEERAITTEFQETQPTAKIEQVST